MSELNINFEPHSDITIQDETIVEAHKNLLKQDLYAEAKELIDSADNLLKKGFKAVDFNEIEKKIKELQVYLLNKKAEPYEYYSLTEPTVEFMTNNNYMFWIKPVE